MVSIIIKRLWSKECLELIGVLWLRRGILSTTSRAIAEKLPLLGSMLSWKDNRYRVPPDSVLKNYRASKSQTESQALRRATASRGTRMCSLVLKRISKD